MSLYLIRIGEALAETLEHSASVQPELFAGYVANVEFWFREYEHLVEVNRGYRGRVTTMQDAIQRYVAEHGGPHNLDDTGGTRYVAGETTRQEERNGIVVRNRNALEHLIERALKLGLIEFPRHDDLMDKIAELSKWRAT